jgi:single-strand DNA-binding protein
MDIRNEVILYGPVKGELSVRDVPKYSLVVFDLNTDPDKRNTRAFEDHRIVCWGELAERVKATVEEGDWVLVEGKLQTRTWKNRNGAWMRTTEIIANRVDVVERRAALSPAGRAEEEVPEEIGTQTASMPYVDDPPF